MTDNRTALDLLDRALAQTREVVHGVNAEQAPLPTPCQSWNVADLIAHLVGTLRLFEEIAQGGEWHPRDPEPIAAADWGPAVDETAEGLMAAWRLRIELTDRDLQRVSQQTAECAAHSWDIAKATGQPLVIDPEVAEFALAWTQRNLKPEHRGDESSGKAFGPEVVIAATAPAGDRLAAFLGRDAAVSPG
jgi:uncharacterized protein (TIGR03086 family)